MSDADLISEVEIVLLDDDLKRVSPHNFSGLWQASNQKGRYQREIGWRRVKSDAFGVK